MQVGGQHTHTVYHRILIVTFPGWTPLHEACNHGHINVASLLIKAGANVNAKGYEDVTPLHDAALVGQLKLVKLLLSHGADARAKNGKGKTPVDIATSGVYQYIKGEWQMVQFIKNKLILTILGLRTFSLSAESKRREQSQL